MKLKKVISAVLAAAALFTSVSVSAYDDDASPEYSLYTQITNMAAELYIDEDVSQDFIMRMGLSKLLDDDPELTMQLLKYSFESLDPYCEFYTAEEYQSYVNQLNQTIYGIGAVLQKEESYVVIKGFTDGSPAAQAGLVIGDKITQVDGIDVVNWTMYDVRNMILGELDTDVVIKVLHADGTEMTVTVTRQEIQQATVAYTKLDDNIGYIEITNMSQNTAAEFAQALEDADADGIVNIILDLRDNPGGYLQAAVDIAKLIVPAGVIVDTEYRNELYNETYTSDLEETKYIFKVLVNGNTASAAEILASAIQESGAGTLIGSITYGKALIQNMYPIKNNGSAFKITIGRYLTRNGNEINEVGIYPDEEVTNYRHYIDTSKYESFDYKTKWSVGMEGKGVYAAKQKLYILGYYNGAIDEVYDESISAAVASFQADNDLFAYGVLDLTTQQKIQSVFSNIMVEDDDQLQYAFEAFGGDPDAIDTKA